MKKLNFNLKPLAIAFGATALTLASGAVMAQEAGNIDLTAITGAFSASDVITAVMAVAGVLATIYATMTAAKMALRWIRGG
ncbi:hypothetical protein GWQ43_07240 [Alcaligenes faecalis]|uniref:hypothetical protein n=1 Tax=Alcaligenes faecalis TaxID=511 RepID=UPI00137C2CC0|nr:hypothetical protein [Alcaligenes faecalis]QHS35867.1 hypothetical protein GWQ43_07240 [Alcaligenes faecalis]